MEQTINLALLPTVNLSESIIGFSRNFYRSHQSEIRLGPDCLPHISIVQFHCPMHKQVQMKDQLKKFTNSNVIVKTSALSLKLDTEKKCWVEIQVLKNQTLQRLQDELLALLSSYQVINGTGDDFRPHITIAKIAEPRIDLMDLDTSILKQEVNCHLGLGICGTNGEFLKNLW